VLAVCFYAFRVCNTNRTLRNERCGESERKFPNEAGKPYKEIFKRYQGRRNLPKSQTYSFVLQTKPTESKPAGPWPASPPGSRSCGNSTRSFSGWKGAPTGRCELAIKKSSKPCFCTLSKIFKTHTLSCWPTLHSVCAHYWLVRSAFVDMITSDELDQTRFSSHNWGLIELDENRFRRNVKEGEKRRERRKKEKGGTGGVETEKEEGEKE